MAQTKTIIYLTDNSLEESIASRCRELLVKEAGEIPIVSVSQKPIELGKNICVGEIGRSWRSLYTQLQAGLDAVTTKYINIAEHDCVYSKEHLNWIPPTEDMFYYNHHFWLAQWHGWRPELEGMFSYWPKRYALSQLVCATDLLRKSVGERLALIKDKYIPRKGLPGAGEPGVQDSIAMIRKIAASGSSEQLQAHIETAWLTPFKAEPFYTTVPNLDIRHSTNFTGTKRGRKRRFELAYWGKLSEVMCGA